MKSLQKNKEIPSIAATEEMKLKRYKKEISIWQNQLIRMVNVYRQQMMCTEKRSTQEVLLQELWNTGLGYLEKGA